MNSARAWLHDVARAHLSRADDAGERRLDTSPCSSCFCALASCACALASCASARRVLVARELEVALGDRAGFDQRLVAIDLALRRGRRCSAPSSTAERAESSARACAASSMRASTGPLLDALACSAIRLQHRAADFGAHGRLLLRAAGCRRSPDPSGSARALTTAMFSGPTSIAGRRRRRLRRVGALAARPRRRDCASSERSRWSDVPTKSLSLVPRESWLNAPCRAASVPASVSW